MERDAFASALYAAEAFHAAAIKTANDTLIYEGYKAKVAATVALAKYDRVYGLDDERREYERLKAKFEQ